MVLELVISVLAILGISFVVGMAAILFWKKDSPQWKVFLGVYTFFPAVISMFVFFVLKGGWLSLGYLSFTTFPVGFMALGFAIPVGYYAINLAAQLLVSSYKIKKDVEWKKLPMAFLLNIVVLIVFVAGEEIGWRGFLQLPFVNQFGSLTGVVLLGLVWGIWHAPAALRGYNLSKHFWAETFLLYPFICVCYSFPMAFLTLETNSIWPALIFHATNNALGSIGAVVIERQKPGLEIAITMLTGVLLLGFAVLL